MSLARRNTFILIAALCLSLLVAAQSAAPPKSMAAQNSAAKTAEEPEPDVPLEQWLTGPDHTEIPAEFKAMPARLTYQQRFLVEARAAIAGDVARGRDFHTWLRVADHTGTWLPGHVHIHSEASTSLTRQNEFQFVAGFYASPGQYSVGIVIYDAKSKKYDVRHLPVKVEPVKNDPLESHLESSGNAVEFLSEPPPGVRSFQSIGEVSKFEPDSLWPFARKLDSYPLASTRPLQIDLVLNFSDGGEVFEIPPSMFNRRARFGLPEMTRPVVTPETIKQRQKEYLGALLSAAQVIAAIHPANGCVRISGIDITSMEAVFQRTPPEKMEWEKLRNLRTTTKLAEVSVSALQNRKEQPIFLRDYLTSLQAPIEHCGTSVEAPLHAVIFVSHSFAFPNGSHKDDFHLADRSSFRVHYIQLNAGSRTSYDDLGSLLKSADAKSHEVYEPRQFREALAKTISDLSSRAAKK
jgi:hypothetical protein